MAPPVSVIMAVSAVTSTASLGNGVAALHAFELRQAIELLERARGEGPYDHERHIELYESLGIAYASVDRGDDAIRAFEKLLALDPGHAVSYTLSPKVTFRFEEARNMARQRPRSAIDLSWPLRLAVTDAVPIVFEVVSDPLGLFDRARVHYRLRGEQVYRAATVALPRSGQRLEWSLPPVASNATEAAQLEVFMIALDERGNEVQRWASRPHPRTIALEYTRPEPWYERWWIWALAGTAVAAGTGVAVYAATREPGPTVDGLVHGLR